VFHICNFIYPQNTITGQREFWYLPKCIEAFYSNQTQSYWRGEYGRMLREWRRNYAGQTPIEADRLERMQIRANHILHDISQHAQIPERRLDYEATIIDTGIFSHPEDRKITVAGSTSEGKIFLTSTCVDLMDTAASCQDTVDENDVLAAVIAHEVAHSAIGHARKEREISLLLSTSWYLPLLGLATTACARFCGHPASNEKKIIFACVSLFLYSTYQNFLENRRGRALKRSREMEYEADKYAIYFMHAANYNLQGSLVRFQAYQSANIFGEVVEPDEHSSTHPSLQSRIEASWKTIQEIQASSG